MTALKTLVSWIALLFHFLFCLAIAGLGALGFATGSQRLHLEMLPWAGNTLCIILLAGGLFGLLSVFLAASGRLRLLFLLWSFAAAVALTKTLVFSGYRFSPGTWRPAAYLVAASWFAFLGAICQLGARPSRGPRKYRVK